MPTARFRPWSRSSRLLSRLEASRFILVVILANAPRQLSRPRRPCLAFTLACTHKFAPPPLLDRPARKLDPPRPELMPGVLAPRFLPAAQKRLGAPASHREHRHL